MSQETREGVKVALDAINFAAEVTDVTRDWMVNANCRTLGTVDPDKADAMFFPVSSRSDTYRAERRAMCGSCPVQKLCEQYGNRGGGSYGAWGGYTDDERRSRRAFSFTERPVPTHWPRGNASD